MKRREFLKKAGMTAAAAAVLAACGVEVEETPTPSETPSKVPSVRPDTKTPEQTGTATATATERQTPTPENTPTPEKVVLDERFVQDISQMPEGLRRMVESGEVAEKITTTWGAEAALAYHPNLPDVLVYVDPKERGGMGEVVAFVNKKENGAKYIEETPEGVNFCAAYTDMVTAPILMINNKSGERAGYTLKAKAEKPGYDPNNVDPRGPEIVAHFCRLNLLILSDPDNDVLDKYPGEWFDDWSATSGVVANEFVSGNRNKITMTVMDRYTYKYIRHTIDLGKPFIMLKQIGDQHIKIDSDRNMMISFLPREYGSSGFIGAYEVGALVGLSLFVAYDNQDGDLSERVNPRAQIIGRNPLSWFNFDEKHERFVVRP